MSKIKTFIVVSVLLIAIAILTPIYNAIKADNQQKLVDASISLGKTVIDIYKGEYNKEELIRQHREYLSEDVIKSMEDFNNILKSKEHYYIDLDEIYENKYKHIAEPEDIGLTESLVAGEQGVEFDDFSSDLGQYELYDSNIEIIDGRRSISTSNLSFSKEGIAYVLYNGLYIEIKQGDLEETYDMIINNPEYNYRYIDHLVADKFIDIKFTSMYNKSKSKIVRVYYSNRVITDFEVK